jgi:hypothetical protein
VTAEVRHVLVDADQWQVVPHVVNNLANPDEVVVAVDGAATCAVVGALADQWTRRVGVWLRLDEGYGAALASRDVATLSWLVDLSMVVLSSADQHVAEHARVFTALLSGDEVTVRTPVAEVTSAFNRPGPRAAIAVATSSGGPHEEFVSFTALESSSGVAPWNFPGSSRRIVATRPVNSAAERFDPSESVP